MSDHCLVVCDMWKVGPAGAQSARHDRLLRHHVTLDRPFPKADQWQPIQWEEWTQLLQRHVYGWNQLRAVMDHVPSGPTETCEAASEVRRVMDNVWTSFIASVKTQNAIINGPNPVRWRSQVFTSAEWKGLSCLRNFVAALLRADMMTAEENSYWVEKLKHIEPPLENFDWATSLAEWNTQIPALNKEIRIRQRELNRIRSQHTRQRMETVIQLRTNNFLGGRTKGVFTSIRRKLDPVQTFTHACVWKLMEGQETFSGYIRFRATSIVGS